MRMHPGVAGSFDRDNQSLVSQATQHLIERTSRGIEASAGLLFDVLSDRVSVGRALPKGKEDVEHQIRQGRSGIDILHGVIGRRPVPEGCLTANYSVRHYSDRSAAWSRLMACRRLAGISAE